ncbi:MAG: hypothetical protein SH847_20385 [Roseiflexaceae bacterium]|nr:hypothetical protein [Roseiflexaceae bacterium]
MTTYRLSPSGRRTTIVLLIGALIIWAFAIWTLRSTLATDAPSPTIGQIIPALLMIVLIIATPLVVWNLLEEWSAAYTPADDGLRFTALGIDLIYPWAGIARLRAVDDDTDEPMHELLFNADYTSSIRNPLLRFLHAQAYGRTKLPIYAGLAERDALIAEIHRQAPLLESAPAPSASAESRV